MKPKMSWFRKALWDEIETMVELIRRDCTTTINNDEVKTRHFSTHELYPALKHAQRNFYTR